MQTLPSKYRPRTLQDLRGNPKIVSALKSFVRNPTAKAFLLSGPPGCGKTSAAYAIARELGCDFDVSPKETGGIFEIASGELTADTVREMFRTTLSYRPFFGSGWKVVIANEADNMSDKAAFIFLDVLEHLPPRCVVVFTTNDASKLPSRFRQRCECHNFSLAARIPGEAASPAELEAQALIDDVWRMELGHNHSPRLAELDGWKEDGHVSFRSVLSALEPLVRCQREQDQQEAERQAEIARASAPVTAPGSGRRSVMAEMEMAIAQSRAVFAS